MDLAIGIIASVAVVVIVGWLAAWRWRSWRELDGVAMRYVREQAQAAIKRDAQMRVLADELQLARRDTAKTDAQIAEIKSGYIQHTRLTDCCISELYARVDALETLPAVDAEGKPNPHMGGLIADVRHRLEGTMSAVNDFHNRAVDSAELAFMARRRGDDAKALELFAKALADEEAALAALDVPIQPTSAVLHRSAATIALHAGRRDDARRSAQAGLASDPPPEIAAELREVLRAAECGFAIGATDSR